MTEDLQIVICLLIALIMIVYFDLRLRIDSKSDKCQAYQPKGIKKEDK